MRELPIIFSSRMVNAIRGGIKTQTRRVVKSDYTEIPYSLGDRLYIRESFTEVDGNIIYRADIQESEWNNYKWRPSIFMKKEHAREWLEIEHISLEKLQDITPDEMLAEGIEVDETPYLNKYGFIEELDLYYEEVKKEFIKLWDSLYEKKGFAFEKNPLVWVITFKRLNNAVIFAKKR